MGEKTIRVDEKVWYELTNLKLKWRMKSLNEVVAKLLRTSPKGVSE